MQLGNLDDATPMAHMQLVLQPSAARKSALEKLVSAQHDPTSPTFHKWITPEQYGNSFGVTDADVSAVTGWLSSQGFAVNAIYPNKSQIDFTGTAGQVRQAFKTQLAHFATPYDEEHVANVSDISVPLALKPVVRGVVGLNDFSLKPLHKKPTLGTFDAKTNRFNTGASNGTRPSLAEVGPRPQAIGSGTTRGLVPYDMAKVYNIDTVRASGTTGAGVTIAVVEDDDMVPADWTNFVQQFDLKKYGGTFKQINPASPTGPTNCQDPNAVASAIAGHDVQDDGTETVLDAEWATAIAPAANIVVASCSDYDAAFMNLSSNFFGGTFIAATNLVNAASDRPDIISASYGFGEHQVDDASKAAIDEMWAQADVEGISVFVASGDSGSNPSFNGLFITGDGVDTNAFASSPNVTAVGGTDFADVLDGTTTKYFSATRTADYGSALSYNPEIPWNASCGNEVAAKELWGMSALNLCKLYLKLDVNNGYYITSEAGSGGPSSVVAKPAWQNLVKGRYPDSARDTPDVSLFGGSFGDYTGVVLCTADYPCTQGFTSPVELVQGTSLSAPMFAAIQALIDQNLVKNGLPSAQGNAAPTLYALAANEYGSPTGASPASLASCNADNGTQGTSDCVFHNVTRGSISTNCVYFPNGVPALGIGAVPTPNCFFYGDYKNVLVDGLISLGPASVGLTSLSVTKYGAATKAYEAQPGWSFASGLGSVNVKNLLAAWRTYAKAPVSP
jgi:subtilase family serine protease